MLTFPLTITWAELALLPNADADYFAWDDADADEDEPDLASRIASYTEVYTSSSKLDKYLSGIGFDMLREDAKPPLDQLLEPLGLVIKTENALRLAHALFCQVSAEYDDMGGPSPTWDMFSLGGDDDVDYCGTQPSCVTSLLIMNLNFPMVMLPLFCEACGDERLILTDGLCTDCLALSHRAHS